MGFCSKWITLVMTCITIVSYSVLVNAKLGAEGLSAMISQLERMGEIQGVLVSRGGTRVIHLFFANDIILFCRATTDEWHKIKNLLQLYEQASGQKVNEQKSSIFFSSNTLANT